MALYANVTDKTTQQIHSERLLPSTNPNSSDNLSSWFLCHIADSLIAHKCASFSVALTVCGQYVVPCLNTAHSSPFSCLALYFILAPLFGLPLAGRWLVYSAARIAVRIGADLLLAERTIESMAR